MATYLYRIGGWAFDHRRTVLGIWIAVLVLVGASAAMFSGRTSDKFEVPGTESQQAQDLLHEKYPGAGGAAAKVVYAAPQGERLTDPENRKALEASLAKAKRADEVAFVIDPFQAKAFSKDQRVAYADDITSVTAEKFTFSGSMW